MTSGTASVAGVLRCVTCGAIGAGLEPWRCPNSSESDRRHVLFPVPRDGIDAAAQRIAATDDPYVRYAQRSTWVELAMSAGASFDECIQIAHELSSKLVDAGSVPFRVTPLVDSPHIAGALDIEGRVWVKDETGGVGGSHKARHLASILLYLLVTERLSNGQHERRPLAIASCGNAALAAATLAHAVGWPLQVFVPLWMGEGFGRELDRLGASVVRCERRDSDPPGDPTLHRFRDAVAGGAIPFTVQGPENALCLDGGRTLGWETGEQLLVAGVDHVDRAFIQVGGGALASCLGPALRHTHPGVRIDPVQAEGCAPFSRAIEGARRLELTDLPAMAAHWSELMTPWSDPSSLADGILDDETYDWIGVANTMLAGPVGAPVVVPEPMFAQAVELGVTAGFDPSPTGASGLAGLMAARAAGPVIGDVLVVVSGVRRDG